MKRISTAIMFIMALVASAYAQDATPQQSGQEQLQLHSFKEAKSEGGLANVGVMFKKDEWPTDANGEDCAWVRVTFENMPMDDAEKVTFNFGQNVSVDKETGGEAAKVNDSMMAQAQKREPLESEMTGKNIPLPGEAKLDDESKSKQDDESGMNFASDGENMKQAQNDEQPLEDPIS